MGGAHPYKKNTREEHVGGAHPYKKIKIFFFLGLDNNPIITYKQISCNNN